MSWTRFIFLGFSGLEVQNPGCMPYCVHVAQTPKEAEAGSLETMRSRPVWCVGQSVLLTFILVLNTVLDQNTLKEGEGLTWFTVLEGLVPDYLMLCAWAGQRGSSNRWSMCEKRAVTSCWTGSRDPYRKTQEQNKTPPSPENVDRLHTTGSTSHPLTPFNNAIISRTHQRISPLFRLAPLLSRLLGKPTADPARGALDSFLSLVWLARGPNQRASAGLVPFSPLPSAAWMLAVSEVPTLASAFTFTRRLTFHTVLIFVSKFLLNCLVYSTFLLESW